MYSLSATATQQQRFVPGAIVSICKPSDTMKKLTFQWTEPDHVVVSVSPATCVVRSLVAHGGVKVSSIAKAGRLPTRVINHKMMRPYPVPPSFMLGAVVCKQFGNKWFKGTVDRVHQDENEICWHVTYSDFDEEDLEAAQLAQVLLYHPLVDHAGDIQVPDLESFVWFARNNMPVIGKVVAVDATLPRPISVLLYQPESGSKGVVGARFVPATNEEGDKTMLQLTPQQVVMQVSSLTTRGYLRAADRRRLAAFLEDH